MTTAREIIRSALEDIGVLSLGETLDAGDADLAFRRLNRLIDSLANEPLFTYSTTWQTFNLSTQGRTIGPGAQVNVDRPVRIARGGFVRVSGVDYPLTVLDRDEYARVSMKSQTSAWPAYVYYDGGYPTGNLYFWPVPASTVQVHLPLSVQLPLFVDLDTDYDLPQGYQNFIELSLAEQLCVPFRVPVPADLRLAANKARSQVKRANSRVPQLEINGPILPLATEGIASASSDIPPDTGGEDDTTYVVTDYVVTDYVV